MGEERSGAVVEALARPAHGIIEPTAALIEEEARAIYRQGEEAVVFALLRLSRERAEWAAKRGRQQGAKASTPSGRVAVYETPPVSHRGKKPGPKPGYVGVRREPPVRIRRREEHRRDRGQTLSPIVAVLNFHLQFQISEGGRVGMSRRLQEILYAWYQRIGQEAKKASVLHADETDWRVGQLCSAVCAQGAAACRAAGDRPPLRRCAEVLGLIAQELGAEASPARRRARGSAGSPRGRLRR